MRNYLEELLAYLIIPDRWIPAWFLWVGDGSNGKTLLVEIVNLLLDPSTIESDRLKAFSNNFGMERLIGKTLVVDDDLDTNTMIPDGFVKKISEGKLLSADRKNKTSMTFYNRSALLLLSNNFPRLTDVSSGTRRRLQCLEFPRHFYRQEEIDSLTDEIEKEFARQDVANTDLIDMIKGELPGVINTWIQT